MKYLALFPLVLVASCASRPQLVVRPSPPPAVEPVEAVGAPFDPELHEAIDEAAVDDPELDGRVVEQYQSGYRLGDRLVRLVLALGLVTARAADAVKAEIESLRAQIEAGLKPK